MLYIYVYIYICMYVCVCCEVRFWTSFLPLGQLGSGTIVSFVLSFSPHTGGTRVLGGGENPLKLQENGLLGASPQHNKQTQNQNNKNKKQNDQKGRAR